MLLIPVEFVNDTVVVKPAGEIDLTTAPVLRAVLDELIWTGQSRVVVDLTGVAFLAVAGARCLSEAEADLGPVAAACSRSTPPQRPARCW